MLKPVADEIAQKADVMLIGYAGGGVRNIFIEQADARRWPSCKGLKVRVQGAPIWCKTFAAVGMSPTVIAYNEVYNAIQNGVINAGENEAAGVEAMKFYEVGAEPPDDRARDHHPAACASRARPSRRCRRTCRRRSSRPARKAGAYGRQIESSEDAAKLDALEKAGKLKRIPFKDRAEMKKLVDPVMAAYAKEIGADEDLRPDQRMIA